MEGSFLCSSIICLAFEEGRRVYLLISNICGSWLLIDSSTRNAIFYKINDRIRFTHDRIELTHDRTVYMHERIGLTHDRAVYTHDMIGLIHDRKG